MKLKQEYDSKVLTNIEKLLTGFHESLTKFDFPSTTSLSQEKISSVVLSVESCFKTEFAPILDLVLRLPTNYPRPSMNVSQGGWGSSKDSGEEKGKVVGKVISTQILTSIQMKSIVTSSTTTTKIYPNVEFNILKLQSNKGLNINEGGSGSSTAKPVTTFDPKDKGKGVHVEPTTEEKKKLREIKMEKLRQLNNIMSQIANDPPHPNKGDPNKVWCNEIIEGTTFN